MNTRATSKHEGDPMQQRQADYPIDAQFLQRWSPRAFLDAPITEAELLTMLEAARWAPSSYNSQPWRFIYGRRDTPAWTGLLDLLVPFNRNWAQHAAALVVVVSSSLMRPPGSEKDVPSHSHSFDAGAAAACLALQATAMGWHVHGMVGFDLDRAFASLGVPAGYRVEAMFAIGRIGEPESLPEALRAREMPNGRLPLRELAFEGRYGG